MMLSADVSETGPTMRGGNWPDVQGRPRECCGIMIKLWIQEAAWSL
jgi:hypothetical protein